MTKATDASDGLAESRRAGLIFVYPSFADHAATGALVSDLLLQRSRVRTGAVSKVVPKLLPGRARVDPPRGSPSRSVCDDMSCVFETRRS